MFRFMLALAVCVPSLCFAQVCGWQILPATGAPNGSRAFGEMVYDPATAACYIYGGGTFPPFQAGTWRWNGSNWSAIATNNVPPARSAHVMAAKTDDSATNIVMYAGTDGTNTLSDTWTFNGTDWTLHPGVSGPNARTNAAMVYHESIGKFIHFGGNCFSGCFGETFAWNGSQWSAVFSPTTPPARYLHAMAYDAIRQETVLYGGNLLPQNLGVTGDTWVFDGNQWTQRFVSGPPPLVSHTMAFDPTRGTVVMHGGLANGSTTSQQTWEWNGSQWSLVGEQHTAGTYYHSMAFDIARQQLIFIDTSPTPNLFVMNWQSGPTILPVGGSATAEYPCPLNLGITASGSFNLTYQWLKDGSPLSNSATVSGATSPNLTISPTDANTAGQYRCRVTDFCGTANSGTIIVGVRCLADVNMSGTADPGDFTAWIAAFNTNDISKADQNCDGILTPADFTAWIANFNAGC